MLSHPAGINADGQQQSELLIVEGKSAADALDQVRNRQMQGIYYLQGKIPNPAKLSKARMQAHEQLGPLHALLEPDLNKSVSTTSVENVSVASHCTSAETSGTTQSHSSKSLQYDSIILVPDPDVDGQHNRLLLLQWFAKFLPQVIDQRRLRVFPTPFERCILENGQYQYKTLDAFPAGIVRSANAPDSSHSGVTRFKSLASISRDELARLLCYPLSPRSHLLTIGNSE